jgi:hypothetical protein
MPRSPWLRLAAPILLAFAVGLQRAHLTEVWSTWMLDYARYARPHWLALRADGWPFLDLVGMHPPLWASLAAGLGVLGVSLRGLIAVSMGAWLVSAVLGAVLLRRAAGPLAAAVFLALIAVSPLQVHYATELNNYPLLQLGTAALVVATAAAWDRPTPGRLAAVAGSVGIGLWAHFALAPLVLALGVCAVATRRARLAGAVVGGLVLAAPILLRATALFGEGQTFHNQAVSLDWMPETLCKVWRGRFGTPRGMASALLGLGVGTTLAARLPGTRRAAVLLMAALAVATTWVLAGFTSGAAAYWQTPYWVGPSWLAAALLALGVAAATARQRVLLVVVLLPWAGEVVAWHVSPPPDWPLDRPADPLGAAAVRDALVSRADPARGDVLVYAWPGFDNDQPRLRDPHFAPLRAGDLTPFVADGPLAVASAGWGSGRLVTPGPLTTERTAEVVDAVALWVEGGRVVHVVQPDWSPGEVPADRPGLTLPLIARGLQVVDRSAGRALVVEVRSSAAGEVR